MPGPGTAVLDLLKLEATRRILVGVGERFVRPAELERDHQIPRNTLHNRRRQLEAFDALVRHDMPGPPHFVLYELSPLGLELHNLVLSVAAWLADRAEFAGDPIRRGAWSAVTALGEGWAASLVQALLEHPRSTTELELELAGRLTGAQRTGLIARLRAGGIVERVTGATNGTGGYTVTEWGRVGVGQLAALARFERRHLHGRSVPIDVADGVDALRAALPLIELPARANGVFAFAVTTESESGPVASVGHLWTEVREGRIVRSVLGQSSEPAVLVIRGSIDAWLTSVIDGQPSALSVLGEPVLGMRVVDELHARLNVRP